jgi:RNA polymerase sigma-70 factor (ECF subfamily)
MYVENIAIMADFETVDCYMPDNDTKAFFSQGIEANMNSIYALALRLTRNPDDAEDLVAESVTKAWAAINTLDDEKAFRPWLFRIMHNCFISNYRKKKCRPVEINYQESPDRDEIEDVASLLIQQPDEFLDWWANPEREFTNNLLGDEITEAIEQLPESFRMTIVLVNMEGLSYDEAADVLGVSPGTVRSRMNRGRTLLQKALWEHARDAGLIQDSTMLESKA